MTQRSRNALSFCAATAIGLAYRPGIRSACSGGRMPICACWRGLARTPFESTLGYYTAGLWPMIPGLQRYIGSVASPFIPFGSMALRGDSAFDAMDGRLG